MLYVKPEYYEKFACIADRCEATCCAGWQILYGEGIEAYYELQKSRELEHSDVNLEVMQNV